MIRIIISFGMLVHGLIHLLGFSHEWLFAPTEKLGGKTIKELSDKASRVVGLLWLVASILFIGSAMWYLLEEEYFWIPAVAALLISQSLIFLYWDDAKFGTIANVFVAIIIVFASANVRYINLVKATMQNVVDNSASEQISVTKEMVSTLPAPVQKWMQRSNVIGRPTKNIVRVNQQGALRSSPDAAWMPFAAQQVFTIDPPAFAWSARMKAAAIFDVNAIDKYADGHGNMLVKALYIYKVADASGPEIDQGTLLRYLAEMAWFPQAATSAYIHWEEIDATHARATMSYKGVSASGIYTFNDEGYISGFEAERFGKFSGEYRKEKWYVASSTFRSVNGVPMGAESEVTWKLKDGDFTWLKLEITSVE